MKGQCQHNLKYLTVLKSLDNFVYCKNCGLILYKKGSNKYTNTIKKIEYQGNTEIDPFELYQAYKNTPFTKINPDSPYYDRRKEAIRILEKFNQVYKFSEGSFYLGMTYMDTIFKSFGNKEISNKDFSLYILNSLLIAGKFYEKDLKELTEDTEYVAEFIKKEHIKTSELNENEVDCLKILGYKLDHHSAYDLLKFTMFNGFLFESEVSYLICNAIYQKALSSFKEIIASDIGLNYSPVEIVFSLIHALRKKFDLKKSYLKKLYKIYGIELENYQDCLKEVGQLIEGRREIPYRLRNAVSDKQLFIMKDDEDEKKTNSIADNINKMISIPEKDDKKNHFLSKINEKIEENLSSPKKSEISTKSVDSENLDN